MTLTRTGPGGAICTSLNKVQRRVLRAVMAAHMRRACVDKVCHACIDASGAMTFGVRLAEGHTVVCAFKREHWQVIRESIGVIGVL